MADPITWRTVTGPSLAEASRPMAMAQMGLNASFDKLGQVLSNSEAINQRGIDNQEEAKVQAFLDTIGRAQSPEEVAQLRASGQLDALRQSIAPQHLARIRGADEAREASLMQQLSARNAFADQTLDRTQAPDRDAISSLINSRDFVGARAMLSEKNLRNEAILEKALMDAQRGQVEEGYKDNQEIRAGQAHTRNLSLSDLNISGKRLENETAQLTAQDAREVRRLQDTVSAAQQKYLEDHQVRGKALGALAESMNLPVDSSGMPRVGGMSDAQIALLNTNGSAAGLGTLDTYARGDTKFGQEFYDQLAMSGKYSPAILQKARQSILGGFDTTQLGQAVGNDAAAIDRAAAQTRVAFDEKDASNWYAPGSPDVKKQFDELSTQVPALIDKTTGYDTEEDVAGVQAFVYKMATQGLEVSPGVFLTPSVNDMKNFIRTAEGGWFTDNKRANNAETALKNSLSSSRVTELIKQAEESKAYRRKQAVNELLSGKKK